MDHPAPCDQTFQPHVTHPSSVASSRQAERDSSAEERRHLPSSAFPSTLLIHPSPHSSCARDRDRARAPSHTHSHPSCAASAAALVLRLRLRRHHPFPCPSLPSRHHSRNRNHRPSSSSSSNRPLRTLTRTRRPRAPCGRCSRLCGGPPRTEDQWRVTLVGWMREGKARQEKRREGKGSGNINHECQPLDFFLPMPSLSMTSSAQWMRREPADGGSARRRRTPGMAVAGRSC